MRITDEITRCVSGAGARGGRPLGACTPDGARPGGDLRLRDRVRRHRRWHHRHRRGRRRCSSGAAASASRRRCSAGAGVVVGEDPLRIAYLVQKMDHGARRRRRGARPGSRWPCGTSSARRSTRPSTICSAARSAIAFRSATRSRSASRTRWPTCARERVHAGPPHDQGQGRQRRQRRATSTAVGRCRKAIGPGDQAARRRQHGLADAASRRSA